MSPRAAADPSLAPRAFMLIACAVALVLVAPIWLVDVVPTQDGPIHLAQADMIARFGWGGVLSEPTRTFYEWNARIEPNYSVYAVLAALIRMTGDAFRAQSVYLTLYGLFAVLAAYWAARAETDRPLLPFLLLLPVIFGLFIHFGFFNYALGLPAFLAFAALWRAIERKRGVLSFLALALALFALGLTHLATVVAACLLLAAGGLARALKAVGTEPRGRTALRLVGDGAWSAGAALPALGLIVAFLIAYPAATTSPASLKYSIFQVVQRLVGMTYLFSYTWWELVALAPVIAAMVLAALLALRAGVRNWREGDLVWPVFVVLVLAVSALDLRTNQGVPLAERLAPYSWMGAALAIASRQPNAALTRVLCLASALALAAQSAVRSLAYLGWAETTRTVLETGARHPEQSFAGADVSGMASARFSWRVQPGVHIHQIAAIRARGVGMGSSLPSMRYYGYYPLRYVPSADFVFALPEWEAQPDLPALAAFRAAHRGAPKVVIFIAPNGGGPELSRAVGSEACSMAAGERRSVVVCIGPN
ncbi:hypothetical protein [Phreatobacter sp. AB_2022a]|uniref:hypothetical protein n=1 Tax=Phreatobacter sp. AB_2022a TaxID=3003134 RepID=UPI0022871B9B|nr:hypothetical protein [Phreatobacter sp. AB_2022a]MCZ0734868.1 hypothetical protein [Phreatobacter sp. AB_2022a]